MLWGRQDPHVPLEGRIRIRHRLEEACVFYQWHEFNAQQVLGPRVSRRPSQFADRQQPVNCKLVSPNNALVAVGLTLDAVLERVSCYEEEANASRFGFREDAQ